MFIAALLALSISGHSEAQTVRCTTWNLEEFADNMNFLSPMMGRDHDPGSDLQEDLKKMHLNATRIVAVIQDPADGYTNVRKGKSHDAAIVDGIQEGQRFYAYPSTDSWWFVVTARGIYGYVHNNKIRRASPGDTVIPDPGWRGPK
jgi:hypothetical protein